MKIEDVVPEEFAGNEVIENILTRTSVRRYSDAAVSDGALTTILHAAMSAPSGVNRQPWEFVVVDKPELLKALAEALPYAKMTASAPVAIVVCGNRERFLDGDDATLWVQDLAAASENILLAAHALGLGGVWTCLFPHADRMEAAARLLELPHDIVPFNLIPLGTPAAPGHPMNKWQPDRVHFNTF